MATSGVSAARRTGQVLTGFGALIVLFAVLFGAPVALVTFAGNPLPDQVPTLGEIGTALTSRDDGQLFLRALAVVGWFGWATFAFSVLVELVAHLVRRPAPKLPGMRRQQKAAAALVGSIALIIAASPAATAATAVAGPYGSLAAPATSVTTAAAATATTRAALPTTALPTTAPADQSVTVYRVAKGDYLGEVAERYLDDFGGYRELAKINKIDDPNRIRPGQHLRLPAEATDRGVRPHATGKSTERAATPARPAPVPAQPVTPPVPVPPAAEAPDDRQPTMAVGASSISSQVERVNRPLAVSAVLAVASIVGAQIGAVLGLRRRPASGADTTGSGLAGIGRSLTSGRHRRS